MQNDETNGIAAEVEQELPRQPVRPARFDPDTIPPGYELTPIPAKSEWVCLMFGSPTNGMSFRPSKGEEPTRFWRLMQFIVFGHRWMKL